MADKNKRKKEQFSNDILKDVFQKLHTVIVDNINTSSVIGELFSAKVISTNDMRELHFIDNPHKMCTRLLIILHKAKNPRTFIELREAIKKEESYEWLVEKIDEKYNLMAALAERARTNPPLTPRDEIAGLTLVIGDLRRDNSAVTSENTRLIEENAKLKVDNERLSKDNSTMTTEISRLKDDNKRLCLERSEHEKKMVKIVDELKKERESVRKLQKSAVTQKVSPVDAASGESESESKEESTVLSIKLFKAAVLQRHRLIDVPHKTARDADVIVLQSLASVCRRWKAAFSGNGDLRRRRLKRLFHYNPQLLFTLSQPPTVSNGYGRPVEGLVMMDTYLFAVYNEYNKVEVFNCEDHCKKIKDLEVKEMKGPFWKPVVFTKKMKVPEDMVGSCVTSQLFTIDVGSDVIWRIDSKTGVSDVFVKTGYNNTSLSLVENRLLVKSRDSLLMFDIVSGKRTKEIPLTKIEGSFIWHAIESNRDSFFVSHGEPGNSTVSEIDSKGRLIRTFDNKKQLHCYHMALDSVSRLLVVDWKNNRVVLFDEHLKYARILIDKKRLNNAKPLRLNYNKNNNKLTIGLVNGHVRQFEY